MDKKLSPKVFCIGNTHYDPVWLWTWDEALASIRATFRSALDRMNEYTDYTYSFCTPAVFEMIERVDPELFSEIRRRVREGRWEIEEGWWLQPDCGLALGESYIRQGLYGQRYLTERFGKRASVMFNIDSFGHSDNLPQLLRGCGIDSYVFSRPEEYHRELPGNLFLWKSADGSSVIAYRASGLYEHTPEEVLRTAEKLEAGAAEGDCDAMLVYGITNHGGAPTKAILSALSERMKTDASIKFGSLGGFFKRQKRKYCNLPGSNNRSEKRELPVVTGGINTRDCGVFSNFPEIKRGNRSAEYRALAAERAATLASLFGAEYPLGALRSAWKDIMFNQFHDILGGACVMQAYDDARELQGRAAQTCSEVLNFSLQQITRRICTGDGVWNYVYFNLSAYPYTGKLEAELQWCWEYDLYEGGIGIKDSRGQDVNCQIILERSSIPGFRTRVAFEGTIPALGYATYSFYQKKEASGEHICGGDAPVISGGVLEISPVGGDGCGISVLDKRSGRRYDIRPTVCEDAGDVWSFNTRGFGEKLESFSCDKTPVYTEKGEIMTVAKTQLSFRSSRLTEHITVYPGKDYFDLRYRADWDEPHTVLKYCISGVTNNPARRPISAGVPAGIAERDMDSFEYPLSESLRFCDVTAASGDIFAYDTCPGCGEARLTVLRNPVCGDLRLEKELSPDSDYAYVGRGISEGTVRFWIGRENIPRSELNSYLFAPQSVCEARHGGELPAERGFILVEGSPEIVLDALKKAEDGSGDIIMRLANRSGSSVVGSIKNPRSQDGFAFHLLPFQIKTYRMTEAFELYTEREVNFLEE